MKSDPEIIDALNACLKYEHTIAACQHGYERYFLRYGLHGLVCDFEWWAEETKARKIALIDRIHALDEMPAHEMYPFDVERLGTAADISKVWDYFLTMLNEADTTYVSGIGECAERGDTVTCGILGMNRTGIQCQLAKFESKAQRTKWIGAELYLSEHMHKA